MADQFNSPSRAKAHPISNPLSAREKADVRRQMLLRRQWAGFGMDGSALHG